MTPQKTHYIDKGQSVSASVLSHAETDQVQCQCGEVTAEESHVNSALADHCSIVRLLQVCLLHCHACLSFFSFQAAVWRSETPLQLDTVAAKVDIVDPALNYLEP